MPPRRRDRVEDVYDRKNLRYLEQRLDQLDQLDQRMEQRMDRMMEQFTQQMAALLENQNRRNPNPNSDPDREEIEYDSNSEGDATWFSEEDPSDEAFFVAGGNGEPKFDEEEETVTGIGIGAAFEIMEYILDFDFDGHEENHAADFISRLLGRILSTHERMMRQTTWQVGTWRKICSDDPISKETAYRAKLTAFGYEKTRFWPNSVIQGLKRAFLILFK
ncbi:hypothetical protein CRG98_002853 [Punica granatum]|uniref:Uncharacterized protein n=1 Tax=Punica granatum TaxID=22663 RepID=A0A2I0L834_PUNGR|nr:hypothetical protein CRG98_002853 [Punica granatum]